MGTWLEAAAELVKQSRLAGPKQTAPSVDRPITSAQHQEVEVLVPNAEVSGQIFIYRILPPHSQLGS